MRNEVLVRFLNVCDEMNKRTTMKSEEFVEHARACRQCSKVLGRSDEKV